MRVLIVLMLCVGYVLSQGAGTNTAETHPKITYQQCSGKNSCTNQNGEITIDANWRWVHSSSLTNCYTGNEWDKTLCSDPKTCATNCYLDGADYQGTYGIQASGSSLSLGFVTHGPYSTNIGSRTYLMDSVSAYKIFKLKNHEFTFDVDVSQLPCGLNGALYFVEMSADGGLSAYPTNKAGAKYGTGYCDAQCPHDIKFINGEANIQGWAPSPDDPNSGKGTYGSCCAEMDIWEANSISEAYTTHPCTVNGQTRCSGSQCGDGSNRYGGVCDKDGCDYNPYRVGQKNFFGPSKTVDTTKPFTVVTQFITKDGTDNGDLTEVRRFFVQNGKTYGNPATEVSGVKAYNSITDPFCADVKGAFGDKNDHANKGGLKKMGDAMGRGMVLVMSLWDDHDAHMLWLDSNYPVDKSPSTPGVGRGTCPTSSGVPSDVESQHPDAKVKFFNIKFGTLNSTFTA